MNEMKARTRRPAAGQKARKPERDQWTVEAIARYGRNVRCGEKKMCVRYEAEVIGSKVSVSDT
jgi:hypothetical protein